VPGPRAADCADPVFAGLSLEVDRALEYPAAGDGCFRGEHGALVVEPRPGIVLLGAPELLTNAQVLRADNAAAALRLLGRGERLIWYVPSLDDLVADDGVSVGSLLPPWIRPGLWLGTIAVLALIAWRARRLGPLATEPLSVVVKAIETTRSRGRLYRKAGDRAHAAAALRGAARTRIAERLRLGASGRDPATLVRDVARHVDRPAAEVATLLEPDAPAPTTDHDLITLASELAALDREVRRTCARPDPPPLPGGRPTNRRMGTRPTGTRPTNRRTHRASGRLPGRRSGRLRRRSPARPATTLTVHASDWPPYARRSPRPSSARTRPSRGSWSRCCAVGTS
jgi:hypothetical protein